MGQSTKAPLVGNRRTRNINNFQGQWVHKSRIRVSVPVSHVTHLEDPLCNAAEVHVRQYLQLVWAGLLSARTKSSAADSQMPQWDSSPCKHALILPWRVSLGKSKALATQKPGLQPVLCSSTRDRGDPMGLSLHCSGIWVWGRGEDLQRENSRELPVTK